MTLYNCFTLVVGRKKKDKRDEESKNYKKSVRNLQAKLEHEVKSSAFNVSVPYVTKGNSICKVKVMSHETPVESESVFDIKHQDHVATSGEEDIQSEKRKSHFHGRASKLWSQKWLDCATDSPSFDRVDRWVKNLEIPLANSENSEDVIVFPPVFETVESPPRGIPENLSDEILHANNVIQSLNSSSKLAQFAGIGLRVIPMISFFSTLRSVNLSNNVIVLITHGSLPKGLHTLNLSKNKISTIEGLRELTQLRVLDLSYNRISRIGHGLSNCTLIKELYLGGNKMSAIEGLHRLLKLTLIDLSFNKITRSKALGQLVANSNSLLALNLLGNPMQRNIKDEQLSKAICSLVPKLAYLNKQPVKAQRTRDVGIDKATRVAVGNSSWSARRKGVKRVSQGAAATSTGLKSGMHRHYSH